MAAQRLFAVRIATVALAIAANAAIGRSLRRLVNRPVASIARGAMSQISTVITSNTSSAMMNHDDPTGHVSTWTNLGRILYRRGAAETEFLRPIPAHEPARATRVVARSRIGRIIRDVAGAAGDGEEGADDQRNADK